MAVRLKGNSTLPKSGAWLPLPYEHTLSVRRDTRLSVVPISTRKCTPASWLVSSHPAAFLPQLLIPVHTARRLSHVLSVASLSPLWVSLAHMLLFQADSPTPSTPHPHPASPLRAWFSLPWRGMGAGHVQCPTFTPCSGLFQMPLDVFTLQSQSSPQPYRGAAMSSLDTIQSIFISWAQDWGSKKG